jgi:hypothetical protein
MAVRFLSNEMNGILIAMFWGCSSLVADQKSDAKSEGKGDDDDDKVAGEEGDIMSSSGSDSDDVDNNMLTPRRLAALSDSGTGTSTERTSHSHTTTARPGTGYVSVPSNRSNDSLGGHTATPYISGPFFVQPGAPVRPHVESYTSSTLTLSNGHDGNGNGNGSVGKHRRQLSDGVIIEDIESNPSVTPTIAVTPVPPSLSSAPLTPSTPLTSPPLSSTTLTIPNDKSMSGGGADDKSPSLGGNRLAMRRASMTFPSSPLPELTDTPPLSKEERAKRNNQRRKSRQSGDTGAAAHGHGHSKHGSHVGNGSMSLPEVTIEPPADAFLASPHTSMPG